MICLHGVGQYGLYDHQAMGTDFYFAGSATFKLTLEDIRGEGRVAPRLVLGFAARPTQETAHVVLERLTAEIWLGPEMLGRGEIREAVAHLLSYGTNLQVVVPITRDVVRYSDDVAPRDQLSLRIDLRARTRWRHEGSGQAETWLDGDAFAQATTTVSRADWVTNVISPLGVEDYLLIELPIPPVPERERWTKSLAHLAAAERFYHEGNDPEVLQRCYAAFEALEGAPKRVFDRESNPEKRRQLDEALSAAKSFMHAGRHVSVEGGEAGGFAVDHRDAAFALGQAKVWMSYVARLTQHAK